MTYHTLRRAQLRSDLSSDRDVNAVQNFINEHTTALSNAAFVLGGPAASNTVFLLIESLRGSMKLSRIQRKQLVNLHRLLTLQDVGEPDRVEAGRFAEIDPTSSIVEDICLLAEAMERLLHSIAIPCEDAFTLPATQIYAHRPRQRLVSRRISASRRHPKPILRVVGSAA